MINLIFTTRQGQIDLYFTSIHLDNAKFLQYQEQESLQFYFQPQMQLDWAEELQQAEDNVHQTQEQRYSCILDQLKQRNQYNRDIIKRFMKQVKKRYIQQRLLSEPINIDENERKGLLKNSKNKQRQVKQANQNILFSKRRSLAIQHEIRCRNKAILNNKSNNQVLASKINILPIISFPNSLFAIQTVLQVLETQQNESNCIYKNKIIGSNIHDYLVKQAKIKQAQRLLCRGSQTQSKSANNNRFGDKLKHSGIEQFSYKLFKELPLLKPEKYKSEKGNMYKNKKEDNKSKDRQQTEGSLLFKINKHSYPNINKSHLQRNKKCLQFFIKCSKNNQFEKGLFVNIIKNINQPQRNKTMNQNQNHSKFNTLPDKKQP